MTGSAAISDWLKQIGAAPLKMRIEELKRQGTQGFGLQSMKVMAVELESLDDTCRSCAGSSNMLCAGIRLGVDLSQKLPSMSRIECPRSARMQKKMTDYLVDRGLTPQQVQMAMEAVECDRVPLTAFSVSPVVVTSSSREAVIRQFRFWAEEELCPVLLELGPLAECLEALDVPRREALRTLILHRAQVVVIDVSASALPAQGKETDESLLLREILAVAGDAQVILMPPASGVKMAEKIATLFLASLEINDPIIRGGAKSGAVQVVSLD